ncbi:MULTISPECIES: hypothetical protein [Tateyamaria]|uniref:hypothetical protein n=1 Tax=Tateyamaria TaxID=299261 RepID=UPI0016778178|nr:MULTISPECIES: hypothetical protein [Tateyamaria]MBY5934596.1 hypothetical protein [Tateyamaria omphalii]
MQVQRTVVETPPPQRAFCALECKGCTGMCFALYMMLTREEQDAMSERYMSGNSAETCH